MDISGSESFLFDFMTSLVETGSLDDSSRLLPKLIEIDGYKPLMQLIKSDKSIETIYPESLWSKKNKKPQKPDLLLSNEFCRFYKLRPYMISFSTKTSHLNKLKSNLVYFSQTSISDFINLEPQGSKKRMCTSCLMIYLYRTIHRRIDFFYVQERLPSCFINLHFGEDSVNLINSVDREEKMKYVKRVEDSMIEYWKLLECKKVSGLGLILNYDSDLNPSDDSIENYELIEKNVNL